MGSAELLPDSAGVGDFFAPVASDLVDGLIGHYRAMRARIEQVAAMVTGETAGAVGYFLAANGSDGRYSAPSVERLFELPSAIAALNSDYWSRALALTDVLDCMPQARRNEWQTQIREMKAPDFEEESVRATLQDLLLSRQRFFAERVDGIFRNLSGEHVTNSPAAFGKRMILAGLVSSYGSTCHDRVGYINDLRCVIAKFMGRGEPRWNASSAVVERARTSCRGEWVTLDGGALRLRAFKCGTAHIEVHPDMAWRLNCVLAQLYPLAIPPEFRQKPKKQPKDFVMMGRPLPFAVLDLLSATKQAYRFEKTSSFANPYNRIHVTDAVQFDSYSYDQAGQAVRNEAEQVLASLGGVKTKEGWWQFDYAPAGVIGEICASGCIPDQKSHQFYPTPERLAHIAVELAEIGPEHSCLEPSAGTGGLADFLPKERTLCIEISELHCKVLEAKGFDVTRSDFIDWSTKTRDRFSRVVLNPPFSDGRWRAHVEAAAGLLTTDGRLVAILPASAKGKDVLPGMHCEWSQVFDNEFAGTGVSVVILTAEAA